MIDWRASARLTLAQDDDVFVVRQYYAEVAPRVVVVVDRHPSMALYSSDLPWLSKPEVLREALTAIVAAARAERADVGYLDFSVGGTGHAEVTPHWIAPSHQSARQITRRLDERFDAPADGIALAMEYLLRLRYEMPAGSFVFVISDFLRPTSEYVWSRARARRWDVVPVIVQDPVWEQSFPFVQGLLLPIIDPETGTTGAVRLTAREVHDRRHSNESRLSSLFQSFRTLRFDPVLLDASEPAEIDLAFMTWAARRRLTRERGHRK